MINFKATLERRDTLPGNVTLLKFAPEPPLPLAFRAGQYLILTVPHEVLPVRRLYSVASSDRDTSSFELLIKQVPGGIASGFVAKLAVGQKVDFQGPAGLFTLKDTPRPKMFLATGTGIAPIRSLLLSNPGHTQEYRLLWGLPSLAELYLFNELKNLSGKDSRFRFTICLSREADLEAIPEADRVYFSTGRIGECLEGILKDQPQKALEYYICGRREVVESMREFLYSLHVDKESVFFERY